MENNQTIINEVAEVTIPYANTELTIECETHKDVQLQSGHRLNPNIIYVGANI